MKRLAAIVLAAGRGSRFGGAKQLALLDGRPLLAHVLGAILAARPALVSLDEVVVVLGFHADAVERALTPCASDQVRLVRNPDPGRGIASSLQVGLEALGPRDRGGAGRARGSAAAPVRHGRGAGRRLGRAGRLARPGHPDGGPTLRGRWRSEPGPARPEHMAACVPPDRRLRHARRDRDPPGPCARRGCPGLEPGRRHAGATLRRCNETAGRPDKDQAPARTVPPSYGLGRRHCARARAVDASRAVGPPCGTRATTGIVPGHARHGTKHGRAAAGTPAVSCLVLTR